MNSNVVPPKFAARSVEEIQAELVGFPVSCVEAALRYHASGGVEDLLAMLPGIIEFHLPSAAQHPLPPLKDTLRLNQDIGLDSLSLTEMAFKMDDLFGIDIEIREMGGIETLGDLKSFILRKLGIQ